MGPFLYFLFLLADLSHALVGRCGHTEKQRENVPRHYVPRSPSPSYLSAYSRGGDWQPIRLQVYYGGLNLTEPLAVRLHSAMRGAVNWLQNTVKVRPITAPWSLEHTACLDTELTGPILTDQFEADFVLYVIADMEDNGIAGYSVFCQVDWDTNQPIVGLFYFNGRTHEKVEDEQILATALHEITHSLVFSSHLYPYFTKPTGEVYLDHEIFIDEVQREKSVLKLTLPTVTAKAREAFSCDSINGLELESDGDGGTVGVHWEKRLMYNDYMVADSDIYDIIYSEITVALFQDSGWYQVSYEYANEVVWGFHAGCEFLTEKCVRDGHPLSSDFCAEIDEKKCDFLNLRRGFCDLQAHADNLPANYQYFSLPAIGGSDYYLDYCPIIKPYTNGNCRDSVRLALRPGYSESASLSSRCLMWADRPHNGSLASVSACYPVDCSHSSPSITIGDESVFCPPSGGGVYVQGQSGVLECPPRTQLCRPVPCVNNCYGFGRCVAGYCECEDGSDDCNFMYARGEFVFYASFLSFLYA